MINYLLLFSALFLFSICWFSSWCMDSIRFRWSQSPKWLKRLNEKLQLSWFGRKYKKYWWIPAAFADAWHFWKMVLVGSLIALTSALITFLTVIADHVTSWGTIWIRFAILFFLFSVIWNMLWYAFYDRRYKT